MQLKDPSLPNHPLLGIRIKTTDAQMELIEFQLTQGEPWAWGLFESCPGDVTGGREPLGSSQVRLCLSQGPLSAQL